MSSEWTYVPKSVHNVPVYTMSYQVDLILKWCCTLTEYLLIDVFSPRGLGVNKGTRVSLGKLENTERSALSDPRGHEGPSGQW